MILVATGTHDQGFERLVREVDKLAQKGLIKDVFIQIGCSEYIPNNCAWRRTVDFNDFEILFDKADLIISHGGAGCIAQALERNKPLIIVPRRKKYNEHTNDHQLELALAVERSGRAKVVYEVEDLENAIVNVTKLKVNVSKRVSLIIDIISNYLNRLQKEIIK